MWGIKAARRAILLFAMVNAALFGALLPLWEGFDEPYHYGYLEELWQSHRLPVFGRTPLPYDVVASFQLAPVSSVLRRAIPEAIAYDAWFALPDSEREWRRHALEQLPADPRIVSRGNYEAHQPPLAYLLLAPLDWSLAKFPLTVRVLALRLFCGVASVALMFFGASALCRELEVPEPFATVALFGIFCSEMLYATTAHVANDWLAVGVSALFLAALAGFVRAPGRRAALVVAAWLAVGLLTKSYFLVFAVFAAGVMLWQCRSRIRTLLPAAALVVVVAGPWYARNLVLYGNIGGTPEAFDGIGIRQAVAAARRIDWPATAGYLARASLWTGNNWFNSYSRTTLNVLLLMLALAMVAWCWRRRSIQSAEWTMLAAVVVFLAAIVYEGCAMVADRPGQIVAGPSPWYTQVLLAPVMALACLGLSGWKRARRMLAGAMVTLWAWILAATWTFKLFPMYAGGFSSAIRARDVWNWWMHSAAAQARTLSMTALAPAAWLYAGLAVALSLTAAVWTLVMKALIGERSGDR
jgi:hypothetical protein